MIKKGGLIKARSAPEEQGEESFIVCNSIIFLGSSSSVYSLTKYCDNPDKLIIILL
jgi:hypothetical protein